MGNFPNDKQRLVLNHRGKPLIVVAGPGTGKTTTLVKRMIQILKADPNTPVALITFTRLSRRTSDRDIKKDVAEASEEIPGTDIPRVATVHTFAKSLVHTFISDSGLDPHFHILLDNLGEVDLIVSEVLSDLGLKLEPGPIKEMISAQRDSQELKPVLGLEATKALEVIYHFDQLCTYYNSLDMQSLVLEATKMIQADPRRLTPLYLHVDEYQDLNVADQRFVAALASTPERQVVAVGDDAQSIYGFRHAHHTGIGQLFQDASWDRVQFDESIRMSIPIRRASQALLAKSSETYLSRAVLDPSSPTDKKVPLVMFTKSEVELQAVVGRVQYLKDHGVGRKGQPLRWQDFMILSPNSKTVDRFVRCLADHRVPVRIKKKEKLTAADKKMLLALRLMGHDDSLALRQCLELAGCELAELTLWRYEARKNNQRLFEYLRKIQSDATDIIRAIDNARTQCEDPDSFLRSIESLPGLSNTPEALSLRGLTKEALGDGPVSIGRVTKELYERLGVLDPESDITDEDKVLVTTIHSAKGLEAEVVFLVQMNAGLMPQIDKDLEEQRRLLYVAMTRAKTELTISFLERSVPVGQGWKHLKREAASPFLLDIADELREEVVAAGAIDAWVNRAQHS